MLKLNTTLDDLLTAVYVFCDDLLKEFPKPGPDGRVTDAELICLAIAQVLLDCPKERRWLRIADRRVGHLFPNLPERSRYNRRLRGLGPRLCNLLAALANDTAADKSRYLLFDSTPLSCAQSRSTVLRSELAGICGYGYSASHSRYFWGFRLYLLTDLEGQVLGFELAAAGVGERQVARGVFGDRLKKGQVVICDKGFSGEELEGFVMDLGSLLVRPDRKNESERYGSLGWVRQRIEAIFWTLKGQLSLERHGGRSTKGVIARVLQRLVAMSSVIWYNRQIEHTPVRSVIPYDH